MGVPLIWEVLKDGFGERIPFSRLVTEFYLKEHRPIRIAIDAYQWLFESRAGITPQQEKEYGPGGLTGKTIQLFMSRTRLLISLNVCFVYVFDGKFKPRFKRKLGSTPDEQFLHDKDYESHLDDIMRRLRSEEYHTADSPDIRAVKQMLRAWNITFCEAPADGEAEAARLQKEGIVDYVLSNDTDTLSQGATRVLRNFSKFLEDNPSSAQQNNKAATTKEFMVTPVHIEDVEETTGFDSGRLTFFSILNGADYNNGVSKLGGVRSAQLALCGTLRVEEHAATFPYDELEDFSEELQKIYTTGLPSRERKLEYSLLQKRVLELIKTNAKALFGRKDQFTTLEGWAPDFVVQMYYSPIIRPDLFKWSKCTNNAEYSPFPLINFNPLFTNISKYKFNVSDIKVFFAKEMTSSYLLKYVVHEMINGWKNVEGVIRFERVRQKQSEDTDDFVLSVRYWIFPEFAIDGLYLDPYEKEKGWLFAMPMDLLPLDLKNEVYQMQADLNAAKKSPTKSPQKSPRKSPKKKLPPASQTYRQDTLSPEKLSPQKATKIRELKPPRPKQPNFHQALKDVIPEKKSRNSSKMFMPGDPLPLVSPLKKNSTKLETHSEKAKESRESTNEIFGMPLHDLSVPKGRSSTQPEGTSSALVANKAPSAFIPFELPHQPPSPFKASSGSRNLSSDSSISTKDAPAKISAPSTPSRSKIPAPHFYGIPVSKTSPAKTMPSPTRTKSDQSVLSRLKINQKEVEVIVIDSDSDSDEDLVRTQKITPSQASTKGPKTPKSEPLSTPRTLRKRTVTLEKGMTPSQMALVDGLDTPFDSEDEDVVFPSRKRSKGNIELKPSQLLRTRPPAELHRSSMKPTPAFKATKSILGDDVAKQFDLCALSAAMMTQEGESSSSSGLEAIEKKYGRVSSRDPEFLEYIRKSPIKDYDGTKSNRLTSTFPTFDDQQLFGDVKTTATKTTPTKRFYSPVQLEADRKSIQLIKEKSPTAPASNDNCLGNLKPRRLRSDLLQSSPAKEVIKDIDFDDPFDSSGDETQMPKSSPAKELIQDIDFDDTFGESE